tara:strand:+ start:1180 stop:1401 length:222 start_codon:yes stop_codon:yes gene_type:complete
MVRGKAVNARKLTAADWLSGGAPGQAHERLDVKVGGGRVLRGKGLAVEGGLEVESAHLVDDLIKGEESCESML